MRDLYEIVLFVHIVAAVTVLLTMLVPLASEKGAALHRRSGWLFSYAMAFTTVTGLVISCTWLAIPHLVRDLPADPAKMARAVSQMQEAGLFFLLLSLLTGEAVLFGLLATRDKRRRPIEHRVAQVSTIALGVASLPVVGLGVTDGNILFIGFGILGLLNAVTPWRGDKKKSWLRMHIESMLGGCTAATTAFAAQTAGRVTSSDLGAALIWGLPVVLGLAVTAFWTRRLRARRIPSAGQ